MSVERKDLEMAIDANIEQATASGEVYLDGMVMDEGELVAPEVQRECAAAARRSGASQAAG